MQESVEKQQSLVADWHIQKFRCETFHFRSIEKNALLSRKKHQVLYVESLSSILLPYFLNKQDNEHHLISLFEKKNEKWRSALKT